MFDLALPMVLRIASALVALLGAGLFVVNGVLLPPPFVIAALLLALSFAAASWARPVGMIAMALSVLVPVAVVAGYLRGQLPVVVPVFDCLLFGWVFVNALNSRTAAPAA